AGDAPRSRPRHVSVRHVVEHGRRQRGHRDRDRPQPDRPGPRRHEGVRDERRCGWLDLVALRYAVRVNGITSLALTKLDVLANFSELPVCVAYRLRDGKETFEFPAHQSDFHHCRPVYETLPGWAAPLTEDLPTGARAYVEFIERALGWRSRSWEQAPSARA